MKRSEINAYIKWAENLLAASNIRLPDMAYWSLEDWKAKRDQLDTVRKVELGWDITDFGSGDFAKLGAVLYTVRNGLLNDPKVGVPYCEKYIVMKEQLRPAVERGPADGRASRHGRPCLDGRHRARLQAR